MFGSSRRSVTKFLKPLTYRWMLPTFHWLLCILFIVKIKFQSLLATYRTNVAPALKYATIQPGLRCKFMYAFYWECGNCGIVFSVINIWFLLFFNIQYVILCYLHITISASIILYIVGCVWSTYHNALNHVN